MRNVPKKFHNYSSNTPTFVAFTPGFLTEAEVKNPRLFILSTISYTILFFLNLSTI